MSKLNVLTMNNIATCGLDELPKDKFNVSDDLKNPDGILVRSAKVTDLNGELMAIARAGAGTNNIPIADCTKRGIVVFNTPGANANGVKELAIASLMLSSRSVYEGIKWTQSLDPNSDVPTQVEKGKSQFAGPEILGKTLGVVGLGAIGGLVANAASMLGMKVVGYDPHLSVDGAWNLHSSIEKATKEDEVYSQMDYLTVHIPVLPETRGKFNKDFFAKVKPGVRIINFSREELFNNTDLLQAIEEGIVESYVTDFPSGELLGNPKVITIPHLGSSTPESEDTCAVMAGAQLRDYILHGNIRNSVNFPATHLPHTNEPRLCVFNENKADVLGKITSILGDAGLNINEMVNRAKGDVAYTIIDLDSGTVPLEKIKALPEVIRARVIN